MIQVCTRNATGKSARRSLSKRRANFLVDTTIYSSLLDSSHFRLLETPTASMGDERGHQLPGRSGIEGPTSGVHSSSVQSMSNGTSSLGEGHVLGLSLERVQSKELKSGVSRDSSVSVELDDPLVRVENLVWIKRNTYYKAALDDWEQQRKSLGGKLERREKRAEELTNQVYNVVGFFSVFQGVILSAVAQLNSQAEKTRPLCNKVWYPVALSLLAAFAAGVGIVSKFIHLRRTDKSIRHFKLRLREAERRESLLQTRGERFLFKSLHAQKFTVSPTLYWRLFEELAVIAGLIAFTGFFCMSYFAILCDKLVPQWL